MYWIGRSVAVELKSVRIYLTQFHDQTIRDCIDSPGHRSVCLAVFALGFIGGHH